MCEVFLFVETIAYDAFHCNGGLYRKCGRRYGNMELTDEEF